MNTSDAMRAAFTELADRTTRTGRTAEGRRIREERWEDGTTTYWNCYEGRRATDAEVASTTWKN